MLPVIALVGRPNVGKSTLFNRLTRSRDALVADQPGLTRDRKYGVGKIGDHPYVIVDTGGISGDREGVDSLMLEQVQTAIGEADHIISLDDVRRFRNCLEEKQKTYSIKIFPDAPHGWLNDTMPGRYRREQAEAAWAAQLEFLDWLFDPGRDPARIEWNFSCATTADYDFSRNVRLE